MGYRELQVWQRSYTATKEIYRESERFPEEERYAMQSQIRRAAMSIPLNIAEGYSKQESAAEIGRFLRMAMGSANEVIVLLDFARDFGYISEESHKRQTEEYTAISKMLYGLERSRRTPGS